MGNFLDRDPQQSPPLGNGNTFSEVYDAPGRNIFINVRAKF